MSKIEEEGFLSAESESGRIYLIDKYGDFFNFGKNINKLCMSFLVQIKVDWEDDHKLVIQAMYMRTVEMFQGIYLMLERGMMPEAKILARSMLEVTFMLVALQKKPALLDNYKDKHEDSHLKALKSALKFKNNNLKKAVKDNNIEKMYIEKKNALKSRELKILAPKNWAEEAELEDFYNMYYVTYSDSIHANMSSLDDHFDNNEDEINLSMGPSDADLYDVLRCGIYLLINATHSTGLVTDKDMTAELDKYVEQIPEFDRKYIEAAS